MNALRTQLYTPNYYPDTPILDDEFDLLASEEGAEFSDFSVMGAGEFSSTAQLY